MPTTVITFHNICTLVNSVTKSVITVHEMVRPSAKCPGLKNRNAPKCYFERIVPTLFSPSTNTVMGIGIA
jgi:hypothetical protein